jgi:gliding motility-associated-like protein
LQAGFFYATVAEKLQSLSGNFAGLTLIKPLIRKFSSILPALLLTPLVALATHYRAGEISYRQVGDKEYEATIITYTDPKEPANSGTVKINIDWGDQTSSEVQRAQVDMFPSNPNISRNTYIARHLYNAPGAYTIGVTDQNRVDNIENIPNSISAAFYVSSLLVINPAMGFNNSPILTSPPIDDKGCYSNVFIHNPGGWDPDGDSLSYALVVPESGPGQPIALYEQPAADSFFRINPATGQITWKSPVPPPIYFPDRGIYNIAFEVTEYRKSQGSYKIMGKLRRDMQIWIRMCPNKPPVVDPIGYYCVDAGNSVQFTVSATDPNDDLISLEQYGGPPSVRPNASTLNNISKSPGLTTATFNWKTTCDNIQFRPFPIIIKAIDNWFATGAETGQIKVVGPAPLRVKAEQKGNGFLVSWARDTCKMAVQYKVFRRIDSSHWNPVQCQTGVPASTGFVQINKTSTALNPNDSSFYDDNNGEGLTPLINYCYRIVAVFPPRRGNEVLLDDPSEGYASGEVCNVIVRSKPIITHVSVRNTSSAQGSVFVRWLRPDTLDIIQYPPPYKIILHRKTTEAGTFVPIDSFTYASMDAIPDTFSVDTNINTADKQFFYRLAFISDAPAERLLIDSSPVASSVFALVGATDRTTILTAQYKVPWVNDTIIIFRKNSSGIFDSIGWMKAGTQYRDTGLVNKTEYCYRFLTSGSYSSSFFSARLLNWSQEACGIPEDTVRPCPPGLAVTPPCTPDINADNFTNVLTWTPLPDCANDVTRYNIYYKQLSADPYELLDTILSVHTNQYFDSRPELKKSIAGCYVVTSIDSVGNESFKLNEVCIDNCPRYSIPNIFTPNGDGANDTLHPFPYRFVDHISLIIYNRWGQPVHTTSNLDINWSGISQGTGREVPDGVYFYVCDVYETYLEGVKKRSINGTIHVLR